MIKRLLFNLVRRYRHTTIPSWLVLGMDICIFVVSYVLSELLATGSLAEIGRHGILIRSLVAFSTTMLCFFVFRSYKGIIRHTGSNDLFRILLTCGAGMLIMLAITVVNQRFAMFPAKYLLAWRTSVLLYLLIAVLMIMSRFVVKYIYNEYFRRRSVPINVLIYGAGAAGLIAANSLKQDVRVRYNIVAFIDDDKKKVGQRLDGVPVMRPRQTLVESYVKSKNIQQIIIAIPNIRIVHKQAITTRALNLGLSVKAVPHISTWINGSFNSSQIEDIKIEDLLEREQIKLDNINIVREVVDKVVLVTGAAGSIGSEICRQLIQYKPSKIIMLDQAESPMYDLQFELRNNEPYKQWRDHMEFVIANVKDQPRMEEVFEQYRPDLIYHAAAYKHVPFMEENPYEAIYVNVFGTKNLADLAIKYDAEKFVMVSTDKAVNPTNVMGATKRMAEIYIQSRSTDKTHFVTTRFGNVLGSNGSVIPLFKKQLAAGGPLTVTHKDIIRYFMTIPEACNLVLEAGAMGEGGDIFVFDMGKPVKIYDLARRMIQLSGKKGIEIKEIGLRPGEKLYEELLATKENTIKTYHPKIMRAQVRKYPLAEIDREYGELLDILWTLDDRKIVAKMKSIVPEFISNNSIYCELDKKD
ncbi:MAG: polysaccharide biosynthesis protein [Bacteroidales bacterium]|nr:polysaccharide biosynthesis protein [Bacteroidales bacterium]